MRPTCCRASKAVGEAEAQSCKSDLRRRGLRKSTGTVDGGACGGGSAAVEGGEWRDVLRWEGGDALVSKGFAVHQWHCTHKNGPARKTHIKCCYL